MDSPLAIVSAQPEIRGDVLGLLEGWMGPLTQRVAGEWTSCALLIDDDGDPVVHYLTRAHGRYETRPLTPSGARVDPSRWEVRARLAWWLAQGERCPDCDGGVQDRDNLHGVAGVGCGTCDRTGYLRPPHPPWWALDGPGPLTAEQSAFVLAVNVVRVAAGMGPIRGVRGPWRIYKSEGAYKTWIRPLVAGHAYEMFMFEPDTRFRRGGWSVLGRADGPEMGPEGMATADAAALGLGVALLSPDGTLQAAIPRAMAST